MKRIRREADRTARQMRADMDEPAIRPCDLILWPPLRDVFPDCDECKPGMRECVCSMDFLTTRWTDFDNDCVGVIDQGCECTASVQTCVPIPWPQLRLYEVDNVFPDCDECNPETCTCECGTDVQTCQATDDRILDEYEPYELD